MSIWDDLMGKTASDASNAAAQDTYSKQLAATQGLNKFGKTLPGAYQQLGQGYQPYAQAGTGALQQLMGGLGLGGGDLQAFTQAYQSLPGYQSGLETGTQAARRQLNAGNIGQSGAALKGLYRYGSDYENQRSGDYLNRLSGLAGVGMQATGAQAGLGAQGLGAQTGLRQSAYGGQMQSAGTIGQGQVAGAQAEQQALGNLLNTGAYLGGAALSGGTSLMSKPPTWQTGQPQMPGTGSFPFKF